MIIKIKDKYINELNDYGLLALIGILLNSTEDNIKNGTPGLITQKMIAYVLSKEEDRTLQRSIAAGIDNLIQNDLISVYDRYHYSISYEKIYNNDGFYTLIKKTEITKIMNYDSHDKKSGLIRYMVALFSSFNKTKKIGYMSESYISNYTGKSVATIEKYNAILIDLGIIGVIKSAPYRNKEGIMLRTTNIYYRPEDYRAAVAYSKSIRLIRTDISQ